MRNSRRKRQASWLGAFSEVPNDPSQIGTCKTIKTKDEYEHFGQGLNLKDVKFLVSYIHVLYGRLNNEGYSYTTEGLILFHSYHIRQH